MIRSKIENLHIEQGDYAASLTNAWDRDAQDLFIWRRSRGERGSYVVLFGKDGLLDEVFVPENEPAPRASLSVSNVIAPMFYRLMGEAASQYGTLPDVVSAQIAKLEAENKLLREMLERTDRAGLEHRGDLRMLADTVIRGQR